MAHPHYTDRVFRPPAEADSLILQIAIGCPHNTCRFCGMYKGIAYRPLALADMLDQVRRGAQWQPQAQRIFLADGDVMALPYATLRTVLQACCEAFPRLTRVGVYANGSSLAARTPQELAELHRLKLSTAYVGLETGDDSLLRRVGKQETGESAIRGVRNLQAAGAKASVMVLLGLGGRQGSDRHIAETVAVLNRMQPRLLSALRLVEVPGTTMYDGYETASEYQSVRELRTLIADLEMSRTVFTANHVSIPFPVKGRLPHDRTRLVAELDAILQSGRLDRRSPGPLPAYL